MVKICLINMLKNISLRTIYVLSYFCVTGITKKSFVTNNYFVKITFSITSKYIIYIPCFIIYGTYIKLKLLCNLHIIYHWCISLLCKFQNVIKKKINTNLNIISNTYVAVYGLN